MFQTLTRLREFLEQDIQLGLMTSNEAFTLRGIIQVALHVWLTTPTVFDLLARGWEELTYYLKDGHLLRN